MNLKNPYVLAGAAVFLLVGAYIFGVEGVLSLFEALNGIVLGNAPALPK